MVAIGPSLHSITISNGGEAPPLPPTSRNGLVTPLFPSTTPTGLEGARGQVAETVLWRERPMLKIRLPVDKWPVTRVESDPEPALGVREANLG